MGVCFCLTKGNPKTKDTKYYLFKTQITNTHMGTKNIIKWKKKKKKEREKIYKHFTLVKEQRSSAMGLN